MNRDVVTRHFETLYTKAAVAPGTTTDRTFASPLPSLDARQRALVARAQDAVARISP